MLFVKIKNITILHNLFGSSSHATARTVRMRTIIPFLSKNRSAYQPQFAHNSSHPSNANNQSKFNIFKVISFVHSSHLSNAKRGSILSADVFGFNCFRGCHMLLYVFVLGSMVQFFSSFRANSQVCLKASILSKLNLSFDNYCII